MTYTMKDSGIEWIGMIPEHWNIAQINNIGKVQTGNTPTKKDDANYTNNNGFPWITPNDLKGFNPITFSKQQLSPKGKNICRIIKKNSVLICCIGTIGKMGVAGCDLSTNQQINSISFFDKYYHAYGKYVVYASRYEHKKLSNKNVIAIIKSSKQKKIIFPVPPRKEQEAIASYLDKHVGALDKYIVAAEKKIKLLAEQKTSLIYETVTRGLNPDVKMKNSRIEWIGMIPEHWKIERVKENVVITTGGFTPNTKNQNLYKGNDLWCTISDISEEKKYIDYTKNKISGEEFTSKNKIPVNSLLFSFKLSPGRVAFTKKEMFINEAICAFMPKSKMSLNFLYYAAPLFIVKNAKENIYSAKILNQSLIRDALIIAPLRKEQETIATYLDEKCYRIDKERELLIKKVALLKEYKTSLIFETVTGKRKI